MATIAANQGALGAASMELALGEMEMANVAQDLRERESTSEAMDAFARRVEEFEKLKDEYEELLKKDCIELDKGTELLFSIDQISADVLSAISL